MELTGTFGSPIEKAAASPFSAAPACAPVPHVGVDVGTVGNGKGEADDRPGGVSCDGVDAAKSLGVMTGKGDKAGEDGDADDRYYFLLVFLFLDISIFQGVLYGYLIAFSLLFVW